MMVILQDVRRLPTSEVRLVVHLTCVPSHKSGSHLLFARVPKQRDIEEGATLPASFLPCSKRPKISLRMIRYLGPATRSNQSTLTIMIQYSCDDAMLDQTRRSIRARSPTGVSVPL